MAFPAQPPDLHRLSVGRGSFAVIGPLALLGTASYLVSVRQLNGFAAPLLSALSSPSAPCGSLRFLRLSSERTFTSRPSPPSATSGGGSAMAVTGKTIDVKMVGDAKGYRFEPANFSIKVGDGARFTNVSGGPHDVTFWPDSIPSGVAAQLSANMPNTTAPLTGPLLTAPNQTYVVSFAGLKPGVYHYYCTPHLALGMKGVITVQ